AGVSHEGFDRDAPHRVLHRDGGDRARSVDAKRRERFQVGLNARTAARVAAGDGQSTKGGWRHREPDGYRVLTGAAFVNTSMNMKGGTVSRLCSLNPAFSAARITVSGLTRSSAAGPGPPPPGRKSATPSRPCGLSDFATFFRNVRI